MNVSVRKMLKWVSFELHVESLVNPGGKCGKYDTQNALVKENMCQLFSRQTDRMPDVIPC